jgi:hypothetical protein
MLKKPDSVVLAALDAPRTEHSTLSVFAGCGLAGRPFDHPANVFVVFVVK